MFLWYFAIPFNENSEIIATLSYIVYYFRLHDYLEVCVLPIESGVESGGYIHTPDRQP